MRAFGQAGQAVEFSHGAGRRFQFGQAFAKIIEQGFVERAFAHQRSFARGEHLVLEGLEFLGDVALGTLDRLPARVVGRCLGRLRLADLDVITVHAVVADLQGRNAAGGLFAFLEFDQELVGVGRQCAQFVEFGIEALADHAAITLQRRRLVDDGRLQVRGGFGMFTEAPEQAFDQWTVRAGQAFAQHWRACEPVAQGRQIARPCRTQGDPREDAFEVADAAQFIAQRFEAAAVDQRADRLVAAIEGIGVAQWPVQPAVQVACAHRRYRGIDDTEQGVITVARSVHVEFEVASRGGVEGDRFAGALDGQPGQVRQGRLLGLLDIAQQAAGRADRQRQSVRAEAGKIARTEEAAEFAPARFGIEMPGRTLAQSGQAGHRFRPCDIFGYQAFDRLQAGQLRGQRFGVGDFAEQETTRGQVDPGQAIAVAASGDRHQQVVAPLLEQGLVGDRPGRDDAHHLALDQALGLRRVADLFADRDRFAELDKAGQIAFRRVVGHAGHRNRRTGRGAALGQGDVEQACGLARIVIEQLVEIAHAEEHQDIRMFLLCREELAHQRGVLGAVFSAHVLSTGSELPCGESAEGWR